MDYEQDYEQTTLLEEIDKILINLDGKFIRASLPLEPISASGFNGENTIRIDYEELQCKQTSLLIYTLVIDSDIEVLFNGRVKLGHESEKIREVLTNRYVKTNTDVENIKCKYCGL